MEKATEVYNKLKLQFVGKLETNKPKPQEKDEGENKTEPLSTGNSSMVIDCEHIFLFSSPQFSICLVLCIVSDWLKTASPSVRHYGFVAC